MRWIADWLTKEGPPSSSPLCDFNRLTYELRPGDVLLVEGRSRVSNVIKTITQSTWTHSALYIGRIYDIRDPQQQQKVRMAYKGDLSEQLMVEALLGEGTIIAPVSKYRKDHLRICRPAGLEPEDAHTVVAHAIQHIGIDYDVRHLLDLARFFFPWTFLPRRWRSSLFEHNAGMPTRTVCSSLLASAFNSVNFPILPFIDRDDDGSLRFFKRNPRLFTPKDFDYSPYFDIIKYPFLGLNDLGVYRRLPWCDEDILYNDDERAFVAATRGESVSCVDDRTIFSFRINKKTEQTTKTTEDNTPSDLNTTVREADQ
ncbi:MAG: YiiX/YebB-like N1pC/P60 family cysteine hydrolase [Candidatus Thiodiazotropha sp. L084R]